MITHNSAVNNYQRSQNHETAAIFKKLRVHFKILVGLKESGFLQTHSKRWNLRKNYYASDIR
jgi:hypothetical protein